MKETGKVIIYQVLPRLFGNVKFNNIPNGGIAENGSGKMSAFTNKALREIRKLGITHIWYTGLLEHATQTDNLIYNIKLDCPILVKGRAGSPYAIKDYYDVDPDLADNVIHRKRELKNLIERTHHAKMKVIIDFVANHVARDYYSDAKPEGVKDFGANDNTSKAFSPNNNFYYIPGEKFLPDFLSEAQLNGYEENPAKVTGNDCFSAHPGKYDWYETAKLNYGIDFKHGNSRCFDPIPDTWHKMYDIVCYWAQFGIDGFRCDMAEMVPVEFWEWLIPKVKEKYPDVTFIAEVYNPAMYLNYIERGKFDYLYDKVGLYDTLKAIIMEQRSARVITGSWQSLGHLHGKMLNFLENHDELRIASDFFAGDPWKALPALVVSACMYSNPFLLYAGQELGERGMDAEGFSGCDGRTSIFDYWNPETLRKWYNDGGCNIELLNEDQRRLRKRYAAILNLSRNSLSLNSGDFFDLVYANIDKPNFNPDKQYAFLRYAEGELMMVAVNFDDHNVDIDLFLPEAAFEYFGIKNLKFEIAVDVMKMDAPMPKDIQPDSTYHLTLDRYGYKFVKFLSKKPVKRTKNLKKK
ncbi:MAG: alpha-amylase [Dysgonamonadaceae bacterium]|jgi:glycosidase|nr:alpha-amylase [Dysgonamonadaceae bacterium]